MPQFSDYIVYVDESGDHSLSSPHPHYPIFVLALCVFRKSSYVSQTVPALQSFKFSYFGHDMVVLHERDIRKRSGPFQILADKQLETQFLSELSQIMAAADFTVITSVIQKKSLVAQYRNPSSPYDLALAFCLERLFLFLKGESADLQQRVHVVFERRGKKEDAALELHFRRVCGGHHSLDEAPATLPFEPVFAAKASNCTGMQIADLVARPIGRHVLDPAQPNRAFQIIQRKLRHHPGSPRVVSGYGLKIFP